MNASTLKNATFVFGAVSFIVAIILNLYAWQGAKNAENLDGVYRPTNQVRMTDRAVAELGSQMEEALLMGLPDPAFRVSENLVYGYALRSPEMSYAALVKPLPRPFHHCGKYQLDGAVYEAHVQHGLYFNYLPAMEELGIPEEYRILDPKTGSLELGLTKADIEQKGLNLESAEKVDWRSLPTLEPLPMMNGGCVSIAITGYIFAAFAMLCLLFGSFISRFASK